MLIEVDRIEKRYLSGGSHPEPILILDGIEATVGRGEFVCIIGPSGCGKSTLLRIMNGLVTADSGEVRIDGKVVDGPGMDRGMVFQAFNLFPWMTARGNVEFGLETRGVPRAQREARSRAMLTTVGLKGFEDYYPRQLSGGMQQRVGLARALVIDPTILYMDEPFGALDAQTKVLMQGELATLVKGLEKTVIFVTHDMEEAVFLADRVLVMSQRPATFIDDLHVPLPRPRTDEMRGTAEFASLKEHIWEQLRATQEFKPEVGTPVLERA